MTSVAQGSVAAPRPKIIVVTPVFNDWESLTILVAALDRIFAGLGGGVRVLAVDDGSTESADLEALARVATGAVEGVEVIRLTCNLGHQRAIAIGLSVAARDAWATEVVVMDSDGEDRPEDIPAMLAAMRGRGRVVVAQRSQRSEGRAFRIGYWSYKRVFRLLTGKQVDFGNFSVLPMAAARQLAHTPELWNNFSGSLLRSRINFDRHPVRRGVRYAGQSRMNYASLVTHGLGAISVHSDTLLVRLLLFAGAILTATAIGSATVIGIRLFTPFATPGWATAVVLGLSIISFQVILSVGIAALLLLSTRNQINVVPAIDGQRFLGERRRIDHENPV